MVVTTRPSVATIRSTTTRTRTLGADDQPSSGGRGGLSRSDQIAIGVGISIPLATLIVSVFICLRSRGRNSFFT